jgi:glycosyltransferase involved in cell wall biosynthesis
MSMHARTRNRLGFLSTRFAGTDGVSLESTKWRDVLQGAGYECYWMAGLLDRPTTHSFLEPHAFFNHADVVAIQTELFQKPPRSPALTSAVAGMKDHLKESIRAFIKRYAIDGLILENVLAIPMHVPLALAVSEFLEETGIPALAHHHDFAWERDRFAIHCAEDYLRSAFPPNLPNLRHAVINSLQQYELRRRCGLPSVVVPNVMNFDDPPPQFDDYNADLRADFGIGADDILVLQPTRIIARKGIELTIELIRRIENPRIKLVLSHPAGDEGYDYLLRIQELIQSSGVPCLNAWDRIADARARDASGRKIYTLADLYLHTDLVTYPSHYEGFGNAFLEAVYFKKPVVVNRYPVYCADIEPLGFQAVCLPECVTHESVEQTREILKNNELQRHWTAVNFDLGRRYFSYDVLRTKLLENVDAMF